MGMTEIHGGSIAVDVAATASATTTGEVDMRNYAFGTISNESGGSVTITYYAATKNGGTRLALQDEDGNPVTQVVADDKCVQMKSACAGVAHLYPVIASGTASLVFRIKR